MMVSLLAQLFKKKAQPIVSRKNSVQETVPEKEIPYITPDLSHLTVHELKVLKEVLEKQRKFEADADDFKRQLNDKVKDWNKKPNVISKDRDVCQNCHTTKFVEGRGRMCFNCNSLICGRCGLYTPSSPDPKQCTTSAWRCKACWYNMEFYHKTGFWYHGSRSELVVNRRELMGCVMENLKANLAGREEINLEMKLPGLDDESKWILLRRKDNQRHYPWSMGILVLGGVLVGKDTTYAVIDDMEDEIELAYGSEIAIGDIIISWDGHTLINKSFEEVRNLVSLPLDVVCMRVCRPTESTFVEDLRMIPDSVTGENNFVKVVLDNNSEVSSLNDTQKTLSESTPQTMLSVPDFSDDMDSSQEIINQETFNDNPRNGRIKLNTTYHDSGRLEVYIAEVIDFNPEETTSDCVFYLQLCFLTQNGELTETWTTMPMNSTGLTVLEWNQLYSCIISHEELLQISLAVILWQSNSDTMKVREVIINPEQAALEGEPQWYQLFPHDGNFFDLPSPPGAEKAYSPEIKNIQHAIPEAIVQDNDVIEDRSGHIKKVEAKASAKLRESIAVKTLRKASHHVSDNQSTTRSPTENLQFRKELSQRRRSSLEGAYRDVSDPVALSYMYNDVQRRDRSDSVNISESGIMENYCFSGIRQNRAVSRSNSVSSFCSYQDMTSTTDYSDAEVTKQEHPGGRFKKKRGRSNSKTSLLERLLHKGRPTEANDKILSCPTSPKSNRYGRISKSTDKPIPGDATPVRMNWQLNPDLIEDKLEAVSQQNLGPGQIATNSGKFAANIHRNVGALQLSIKEVGNALQVHIIRAANLMATAVFPDTVIKIYLMESLAHSRSKTKMRNVAHKAKSRIVKNTKSPIYDFMLTFSNYKKSQVIYLTICSVDSNNRNKKRLIGDITIALDLVDFQNCTNRWYCLMSQQTADNPESQTRPRLSLTSTASMSSIDGIPVPSNAFTTREQRRQKIKQQRDRYNSKASSQDESQIVRTSGNQGRDSADISESDKMSVLDSDNSYLERDNRQILQSTAIVTDTTAINPDQVERKISATSETEFPPASPSGAEMTPGDHATDDEHWF